MSQTNTNTYHGQSQNQISGRGGKGQGPSGRGRNDCCNNRRSNLIANKYLFGGKMKGGPISKLIITENRHRRTQYKKDIDTLLVLYADKNY